MFVLGASKDIDPNAPPAEFASQIPDVHIHPTCILATQRRQGTGVIRDHGDLHERIMPPPRFLAKDQAGLYNRGVGRPTESQRSADQFPPEEGTA